MYLLITQKDKYTDLVIIDQFDKEHTIKYKEDEKIIWNTSFHCQT